jgi:pimeloyl-ACP methyl ester carboxylesterase
MKIRYYVDMHIRHFGALLSGLIVLLSFALPASANITSVSTDPAYASGPFSFYCLPYVTSFANGEHYVSQGGNCYFSVPNDLGGTVRAASLYKGVPGNSTVVAGDQFFLPSATQVQEDNINFGTPAQDQDYFGVVYGANSSTDLGQFNTAFTVGSSTNVLLPSNNYRIIKWKWGAKPVSEYDPVIIIPDFLNSWTTASGPVIDPIFKTYQDLTDTFVANGYVANQTLFTFPYNWEDDMAVSAQSLATKIASIKSICGCNNVDIVAHGTGGQVAMQYIESAGYGHDVDQLIFLGTPFYGIPAAYRALEGGQIAFGHALSDGLAQALLAQEAKDGGFSNIYTYIQSKPNSAFKQIVPVFTDYLFDSSFNTATPPANSFLQTLLASVNQLFQQVNTDIVLADNNLANTPSFFSVQNSTVPPLWPNGQPTQTFTDSGDGLVPSASILNLFGFANQTVTASHRDIPTSAQSYIFNTLNGKNPSPIVTTTYPVSCVLFITTSSGTDMQITDPSGLHLGKDFSSSGVLTQIPNSVYSGPNAQTEYGVVANPVAGTYQVQTQGTTNGSFTINTTDVCGSGVFSTATSSTITAGQLVGYGVSISTSTQSITLTPLDTNPPVITITSPQQNHAYYKNETVNIVASIVDPENSPIASTQYLLNGAAVNPAQPLPFSTTAIGTSTLVISATDVFGNKGYATSSFFIRSLYTFGGFLQPINDTGHMITANTSVFKAGSTVPVKFQFKNASGTVVQVPGGVPWISPSQGPTLSSPVTESVYTDQPTSGSAYEWSTDHYQYNWKTDKSQAGYWYYLYVVLGDGSVYYTIIGLK